MTEFKGTLGPWKFKQSQSKPLWNVIGTRLGHRHEIALCPYYVDPNLSKEWNNKEIDEQKSNAQLISKAPEMLEMLMDAVNENKNGESLSQGWFIEAEKLIEATNV